MRPLGRALGSPGGVSARSHSCDHSGGPLAHRVGYPRGGTLHTSPSRKLGQWLPCRIPTRRALGPLVDASRVTSLLCLTRGTPPFGTLSGTHSSMPAFADGCVAPLWGNDDNRINFFVSSVSPIQGPRIGNRLPHLASLLMVNSHYPVAPVLALSHRSRAIADEHWPLRKRSHLCPL